MESNYTGHRRIATALFLKHAPRKRAYSEIEALLSIDMDEHRGGLRSLHDYARIFGHSRNWVRTRIGQYKDHLRDVETSGKESSKDHNRTRDGPSSDLHRTPTANRNLIRNRNITPASQSSDESDSGSDEIPWKTLRNLRPKGKHAPSEAAWEAFLRHEYDVMDVWRAEKPDERKWPATVMRFWRQRRPSSHETAEEIIARRDEADRRSGFIQ